MARNARLSKRKWTRLIIVATGGKSGCLLCAAGEDEWAGGYLKIGLAKSAWLMMTIRDLNFGWWDFWIGRE